LVENYYINEETDEEFNLNYKNVLKEDETVSFSSNAFEQSNKILWRQTASYIISTIDTKKKLFRNTLQCAWIREQYKDTIDLKYVLAILNSKFIKFVYNKYVREAGRVFPQVKIGKVKRLPFRIINLYKQKPFINLVNQILTSKKANPRVDTAALEAEIDKLVYELYGLTEEEIKIVEASVG